MKLTYKWHNEETGEPALDDATQYDYGEPPKCPRCGKASEYWEGTVEQDFMGNDIDACNWTCYHCKIGTELEYLD